MNSKERVYMTLAAMLIVVAGSTAKADGCSQQAGPFATYQNTEDMEDGYGAGLKYVLMFQDVVPNLDCGIDVRTSWLTYDSDDNDFRADLDVIPIEVSAVARYEVLDGTRAYVGMGVGYYFIDSDEIEIDDEVGLSAMLGCDQRIVDKLSVFAEVRYLWLEPDLDIRGLDADVDLSGVGANVGLALNW
jgi:opacity protein-like surface antigen